MKTLTNTTAAEIAAMPADSKELRVLCALAMGYSVGNDDPYTSILIHPSGVKGWDAQPYPDAPLSDFVNDLPDPANSYADAGWSRDWLQGQGLLLTVSDNKGGAFNERPPFYVTLCKRPALNKVLVMYGTTENHATALALAEYGRRVAAGEI